MTAVRFHYLDTSAILKLFVSEDRSEIIRDYFNNETNFHTTSLCFAETLGMLKVKYFNRHEMEPDTYFDTCKYYMATVAGGGITVDEISITDRKTYSDVDTIAEKYSLDIADAFQIVTLKEGLNSQLIGDSKPILITADSGLAKAARNENLRVWDIMKESAPEAIE